MCIITILTILKGNLVRKMDLPENEKKKISKSVKTQMALAYT